MNLASILNEFRRHSPQEKQGEALITQAFEFSKKAHEGQKRKTGEPYFIHPVAAATTVAEWGLDAPTIAATLLHDVAEDTKYTLEDIRKSFGEEIAFLVDGVTKISRLKHRKGDKTLTETKRVSQITASHTESDEDYELKVENLRKMILALSQDIRVIIIKLADRLHNMNTLGAVAPQKQKRIALETLEIYAPLAYRLGMQKLSGELEDLAFPYVYPQEYRWLTDHIKEQYENQKKYLGKVAPVLEAELKKNNVNFIRVDSRVKHLYSLYKKLKRYDMNLSKVHDLIALRVIVKNVEDCYAALGVIHKLWPPLPGRIKDYIALPKPNGYRSLHTTVFCVDNKVTELQIRTLDMHEEAENGIAAHWAYSQKKGTEDYSKHQSSFADKKELALVTQLKSWQNNFSNPEEFLQSLKIDFFEDRIFAITPKGEVIDLPAGSTPVDFAYRIHSDIGDTCVGSRVNGKIEALDYQIESGDIIEILTQKNKKPSEGWLDFVKTNIAKHRIKTSLKTSGKGLTMIEKEPGQIEVKLIIEDRIGLLKDITATFSRSHINISGVDFQQTTGRSKFPIMKIRCQTTSKEKIEKIIWKLKALKEVKEASYKVI